MGATYVAKLSDLFSIAKIEFLWRMLRDHAMGRLTPNLEHF